LEEKSEEEVTMMFEDVDHQAPQDAALFFPADDEFEKDQESELALKIQEKTNQESEKDLAVKRVLKKEKEKQANDDAENTYTFDVFDEDYSYWPPINHKLKIRKMMIWIIIHQIQQVRGNRLKRIRLMNGLTILSNLKF
jgi:hypothetical protein